jgi:hypothetical protein
VGVFKRCFWRGGGRLVVLFGLSVNNLTPPPLQLEEMAEAGQTKLLAVSDISCDIEVRVGGGCIWRSFIPPPLVAHSQGQRRVHD